MRLHQWKYCGAEFDQTMNRAYQAFRRNIVFVWNAICYHALTYIRPYDSQGDNTKKMSKKQIKTNYRDKVTIITLFFGTLRAFITCVWFCVVLFDVYLCSLLLSASLTFFCVIALTAADTGRNMHFCHIFFLTVTGSRCFHYSSAYPIHYT